MDSIKFLWIGNVFHLQHSQFIIQNLAQISDVFAQILSSVR